MHRFTELINRCRDKSIPLSAVYEITYGCNLRCRHCYQIRRKGDELRFAEIRNLLDQLAQLGCFYLAFSGGEPLTREDFFKIASYARKKNFALKILTNATLIDRNIAQKIKELNFKCVDISIYGAIPRTHDRFTGIDGSFLKMLKGTEHLLENGINIRFKMTINRFNIKEFDQIQSLAKNFKATLLADPFITPRNNFDRTPLDFRVQPQDLNIVAHYFVRANQRYFCEDQSSRLICNAGRSVLAISPAGVIYPCEGLQIPAGNIREKPLKEIWYKSTVLKKIRKLKEEDLRDCSICNLKQFCFRCMGSAYLEKRNYLKKAGIFCKMAEAIKRELKRIKIKKGGSRICTGE